MGSKDRYLTLCIVQRFLRDALDVAEYRDEVCTMETVLDAEVADRLSLLIDRPAECPVCFDVRQGRCCQFDE